MKRIKQFSELLEPMETAYVEARFLEADYTQTENRLKVNLACFGVTAQIN